MLRCGGLSDRGLWRFCCSLVQCLTPERCPGRRADADAPHTHDCFGERMHHTSAEIFAHVRLVMGFVISLSIARLLTGATRFIQHPSQYRVYPVHLIWTVSIFLMLIHFWWWEFWLSNIEQWNFLLYSFLVAFATTMFMICTVLYPDSIAEYAGYEDYFYSRRR